MKRKMVLSMAMVAVFYLPGVRTEVMQIPIWKEHSSLKRQTV